MTLAAIDGGNARQHRTRIKEDRVTCWRLGAADLDRCRECPYLVRLEYRGAPDRRAAYVVCTEASFDAEVDFAW